MGVYDVFINGRIVETPASVHSTLRYYDQIGLVKPSSIGAGGKRLYSEDDIIKLEGTINWEHLISLVINQENERNWSQYFTEEEQEKLIDELPKFNRVII